MDYIPARRWASAVLPILAGAAVIMAVDGISFSTKRRRGRASFGVAFAIIGLFLLREYDRFRAQSSRNCRSLFDVISANLGLLGSTMWDGYEQGVALWNKEPSASAVC
jgi:hypothetical protein